MIKAPLSSTVITSLRRLGKDIRKNKAIYAFVLPGVLFILLFKYYPLYFLQVAFRDYRPTRPLSEGAWEGFRFFAQLLTTPGLWRAFRNTLLISLYKMLAGFSVPILLALLLNEIRNMTFRRVTQTIIYLPHFISWVVIGSILMNMTNVQGGLFNEIGAIFGQKPRIFMAEKPLFRSILVLTSIWKESGWGTIIYLASISQISPELYESATIDGANRFQRIRHITLPSISNVVVVLLILNAGSLLNAGFEQILVLQNDYVLEVSDVLGTYIYRTGLLNQRYSYAAAAGILTSVISTALVVSANTLAKRIGQGGIF
jgi:putative aldouronate transport system permease protein